jgi:SAM-dependent methyltransferase
MKAAKRKKEWFDEEDFWRETYSYIFPETRFSEASETVEKILSLVRPQGKAALDLCCGPGRCSIALAKRGFRVTGVDRTPYLLNKAKARAQADRMKIEWLRQDMRDFSRPETYDIALSLFTSFGYFDDPKEDIAVLRNVFASLRSGGAFLLEMNGKEILARKFLPSSVQELADGSIIIERRKILDGWARIHNDWIVVRNGKAKTFPFYLNLYSGQELRDRLEGAGFVDVKLYGSFDGTPYDSGATRLIAVGQKP